MRQDNVIARFGPSVGGGSSQTGTIIPLEAPPLLPLGGPDTHPDLLDKIRTGMCKYPSFPLLPFNLLTNLRVHLSRLARNSDMSFPLPAHNHVLNLISTPRLFVAPCIISLLSI